MRGIAGEKHAALAVALRQQQILLPLADVERVELQRHGDGLGEHRHHVCVAVDDRMQGEVPGRILHDKLGRVIVGDVIVPALAHRDPIEQALAVMQRLPKLQHAVLVAGKLDAELLARHACAAVAADQIIRRDLRDCAFAILDPRRHSAAILRERHKLAAVAHRHAREFLGFGFEQRLQRVL